MFVYCNYHSISSVEDYTTRIKGLKPGTTSNPGGWPPKSRAFSQLLSHAGDMPARLQAEGFTNKQVLGHWAPCGMARRQATTTTV
jgi:hypothetical protein